MPREKRDPTRYRAGRGDARKTMWEAGWHADIRIRGRSLLAKWLHACLWDLARSEMRPILPAHWTPKSLALEVNPTSTPHEIIEALNELATPPALLAFLPDGRIEVLGVKSIHRALEAWKDKDDASIPNRVQSFPIETKRKQSTVDWTVQDGTGRDGTGLDVESKRNDSQGPEEAEAEPTATAPLTHESQEANDTDRLSGLRRTTQGRKATPPGSSRASRERAEMEP